MKVFWVLVLLVGAVCVALTPLPALLSCTPANSPSAPDVFAYTSDQVDCVEQADSRPAADACRAAARASFCHQYPNAAVCPTDAGADQ